MRRFAGPASSGATKQEKQTLGDRIKALSARRAAQKGSAASSSGQNIVDLISVQARPSVSSEHDRYGERVAQNSEFADVHSSAGAAPTVETRPEQEVGTSRIEELFHSGEKVPADPPDEQASELPPESESGEKADPASRLLEELALVGGDPAKLRKVLLAAERLPANMISGVSAHQLYAELGRACLNCERADVKRMAMNLRRRWRIASADM